MFTIVDEVNVVKIILKQGDAPHISDNITIEHSNDGSTWTELFSFHSNIDCEIDLTTKTVKGTSNR